MPQRSRSARPIIDRPHVRRMAIFVLAVTAGALATYGYRFWWLQ
ncbi:hypothetical protein [Microvirga pudoricolor]|nr:hypothetical protein [Microvirga pudoricolor]